MRRSGPPPRSGIYHAHMARSSAAFNTPADIAHTRNTSFTYQHIIERDRDDFFSIPAGADVNTSGAF